MSDSKGEYISYMQKRNLSIPVEIVLTEGQIEVVTDEDLRVFLGYFYKALEENGFTAEFKPEGFDLFSSNSKTVSLPLYFNSKDSSITEIAIKSLCLSCFNKALSSKAIKIDVRVSVSFYDRKAVYTALVTELKNCMQSCIQMQTLSEILENISFNIDFEHQGSNFFAHLSLFFKSKSSFTTAATFLTALHRFSLQFDIWFNTVELTYK